MKQALFRAVLWLVLLIPLQSCAFFYYSAEPIEAWIVDSETKQPLDGVIVVAHWQLKGGLEGGNPVGQMMVMETVTDAKGRFYFPGWGPKLHPWQGELKDESPRILLFKSGYAYQGLLNHTTNKTMRGDLEIPLRSIWNKRTIKLEKFKGTMEEYAEHVYRLGQDMDSMLDFASGDKKCEWKKVPRMLVALDRIDANFESRNIKVGAWRLGAHILRIEDIPQHCGSPKEFLKSYLP